MKQYLPINTPCNNICFKIIISVYYTKTGDQVVEYM